VADTAQSCTLPDLCVSHTGFSNDIGFARVSGLLQTHWFERYVPFSDGAEVSGALKLFVRSGASSTRLPEAVDMLATVCFLFSNSDESQQVGHRIELQTETAQSSGTMAASNRCGHMLPRQLKSWLSLCCRCARVMPITAGQAT